MSVEPAHLALLKALSTDEAAHSGRTLLEHLAGTSHLLEAWGNPPDIVAAGLFHSIYGTAYYKVQSASLDRRADVAAVIGGRAEMLAFLFCVTDRPAFFHQAGEVRPVLDNRVDGTTIEVDPDTIDALIEIEVANVIEQTDPARVRPDAVARLTAMAERGRGHMSAGARAALTELSILVTVR